MAGRKANQKWELPDRVLMFLMEEGAEGTGPEWMEDTDSIKKERKKRSKKEKEDGMRGKRKGEYDFPIEWSALGLTGALGEKCNSTLTNLGNHRQVVISKGHIKAGTVGLKRREPQYVYALDPNQWVDAETKLNELKKNSLKYLDESGKEHEATIEGIMATLQRQLEDQARYFRYACLAKFVPDNPDAEPIPWNDLIASLPFKSDVGFQLYADKENIFIRDFIKRNWPGLETLFELTSLEPSAPRAFNDFFSAPTFLQITTGKPGNDHEGTDNRGKEEGEGDMQWKFRELKEKFLSGQWKKVLIEGDPGAGKTILLRKLAQEFFDDRKYGLIPVYLPVGSYSGEDINEFIFKTIKQSDLKDLEKGFKTIADEGRLVFMFDGLDDISGDNRGAFLSGLGEYLETERGINNRMIISRRTEATGLGPQWTRTRLMPMDWKAITAFVNKYFPGDPEKAEKLLSDIASSPGMTDLAGNPLLLSALCIVYEMGTEFPGSRAEIYESLLFEMFRRSSKRRAGIEHGCTPQREGVKRDLLSSIALWLIRSRKVTFGINDLMKELKVHMPGDFLAEISLAECTEHDGILRKSGSSYQFFHRSFQEFLAADKIKKDDIWKKYFLDEGAWKDIEWWLPVMCFYAGLGDATMMVTGIENWIKEDIFFTKLRVMANIAVAAKKLDPQVFQNISDVFTADLYGLTQCINPFFSGRWDQPGYDEIKSLVLGMMQKAEDRREFIRKVWDGLPKDFWSQAGIYRLPTEFTLSAAEEGNGEAMKRLASGIDHAMHDFCSSGDQASIERLIKVMLQYIKGMLKHPTDQFGKSVLDIFTWINEYRKINEELQKDILDVLQEVFYLTASEPVVEDVASLEKLFFKIIRIVEKLNPEARSRNQGGLLIGGHALYLNIPWKGILPARFWDSLKTLYVNENLPDNLRHAFQIILQEDPEIPRYEIQMKTGPTTDEILEWKNAMIHSRDSVERLLAMGKLSEYIRQVNKLDWIERLYLEEEILNDFIDELNTEVYDYLDTAIEDETDHIMRNALLLLLQDFPEEKIFHRMKKLLENKWKDESWTLMKISNLMDIPEGGIDSVPEDTQLGKYTKILRMKHYPFNRRITYGLDRPSFGILCGWMFFTSSPEHRGERLELARMLFRSCNENHLYFTFYYLLGNTSGEELFDVFICLIKSKFSLETKQGLCRQISRDCIGFIYDKYPGCEVTVKKLYRKVVFHESHPSFIPILVDLIKDDVEGKEWPSHLHTLSGLTGTKEPLFDLGPDLKRYLRVNPMARELKEAFSAGGHKLSEEALILPGDWNGTREVQDGAKRYFLNTDHEEEIEVSLIQDNFTPVQREEIRLYLTMIQGRNMNGPGKFLDVLDYYGVTIDPGLLIHHMLKVMFSKRVLVSQISRYDQEERDWLMSLLLDTMKDAPSDTQNNIDGLVREILEGVSRCQLIPTEESTGVTRYREMLPDWFVENWREKFTDAIIERVSSDPENTEFRFFWNCLFVPEDVPMLFKAFSSLPISKGKFNILQKIWWTDSSEHLEHEIVPYLLENWYPEYIYYIGNFDTSQEEHIFKDQFTEDTAFNKLYAQVWKKYPDSRPALIGEYFSLEHFLTAYEEYKTNAIKREYLDTITSGLEGLHDSLYRHLHYRTGEDPLIVEVVSRARAIPINEDSNEKRLFDALFEMATEWKEPGLSAWAFLSLKYFGIPHAVRALPQLADNLLEAKIKRAHDFENNPVFHLKGKFRNLPGFLLELLERGELSALESILTMIDNGILSGTERYYPDRKDGYYMLFHTMEKGCSDPARIMKALKDWPLLRDAFLQYIRQERSNQHKTENRRLLPEDLGLPPKEYKIVPEK